MKYLFIFYEQKLGTNNTAPASWEYIYIYIYRISNLFLFLLYVDVSGTF